MIDDPALVKVSSGAPRRLGIVVGMKSEARLAAPLLKLPWAMDIAIGGGTADGAVHASRRLVDAGADGLLSFGLAGGLTDRARAGVLICPGTVQVGGTDYATDPEMTRRLGGVTAGLSRLLHSDRIVSSAFDKQDLAARSGCVAVDMETGAVVKAARRAGLPFAVLRAVCDPVSRQLPAIVAELLDAGGGIAVARLVGAVLRRPNLLGSLAGLAHDASLARRALREHCASVAGNEAAG